MRKLIALLMIVAAVVAAPTAQASSKAQVKTAIQQVFGSRAGQATCIARAESHLYDRAVSPSGDHGAFQINARTWFGKIAKWSAGPKGYRRFYVQARYIYDAVYNAKVAYVISHGGTNWGPWSVYTRLGLCH